MAGVTCPACLEPNPDGEALCVYCGFLLADDGGGPARVARDDAAPADGVAPGHQPDPAPDRCPACGAVVPDPANLVCVECLEPLLPQEVEAPAQLDRHPGAGPRLWFSGQPVEIPRTGSLLLGRDPDNSPVAKILGDHDNVSRRHASVGVEPDGTAWVRDEHSTNGTFVNDARVPSGGTAALVHGDQLRIASNIIARVDLDDRPG